MKAVYATDVPLVAVFKAVLYAPKLPGKTGLIAWKFDEKGKVYFKITPNYIKYNAFRTGYVYVSDSKYFKKSKKIIHEFYCKKAITPQQSVKIKPDEFLSEVRFSFWTKDEVVKTGLHTEEEIVAIGI